MTLDERVLVVPRGSVVVGPGWHGLRRVALDEVLAKL